MSLTPNATKISLNAGKIPAGATATAGVNLSPATPNYVNLRIDVDKATVETAVKSDTFDAIRADIEAQVAARLAADDIGAVKAVIYNIDWLDIRNNQIIAEEFYTSVLAAYVCTVNVYVQIP